jgi:hypothetical protein
MVSGRKLRAGLLFLILTGGLLYLVPKNNRILASDPRPQTTSSNKTVDLTNPAQEVKLSKGGDERIIWHNPSKTDLYACLDAKASPFEAYAWYVPAGKDRKSGKIRDDVNASSTEIYYVPSTKPCAGTIPPKKLLTGPHIIINNQE